LNINAETATLHLTALPGLPMVQPGDDLVQILLNGLARATIILQNRDVLVVTSKIVSKAEGRIIELDSVIPTPEAAELATKTLKDPRIVELVLRESQSVSRTAPNTLIVRHRLGFVSANAGIDQSNLDGGEQRVLLLPLDPDDSARRIRDGLKTATGADIGVVISDSHGRPFRLGNIGTAIGMAGLPSLLDLRGQTDLFGRVLRVSVMGYADMVAAAANLLTGEGAEGRPVVHLRGLDFPADADGRAEDMNRPPEMDLYK
jgi:coenzyme F420-0:L-glutamate ligase/coenzyme F420-1:gamma-L-glutamate ligase